LPSSLSDARLAIYLQDINQLGLIKEQLYVKYFAFFSSPGLVACELVRRTQLFIPRSASRNHVLGASYRTLTSKLDPPGSVPEPWIHRAAWHRSVRRRWLHVLSFPGSPQLREMPISKVRRKRALHHLQTPKSRAADCPLLLGQSAAPFISLFPYLCDAFA
jgi:hypothetical protein